MWCSQRLKNSMSFTTTISSYFTSYRAPFTNLRISTLYPLVRNCNAFSTRSGVRCRPSRSGSSPSCSSISRTRGAIGWSCLGRIIFTTALFDFIGSQLKDVPFRLGDANLLQLRPLAGEGRAPVALQPAADLHGQVLRCGHYVLKRIRIRIEIAVAERLQNFPPDQIVKSRHIHGKAGRAIGRPARADVDQVIVSGPV